VSHSSVSAFPAAWRTLANLAQAALPKFLLNRRWYPAKDSESHTATLSTLIPFPMPEGEAAIALWQVRPGSQPPLTLFVPLALVPADAADPAHVIADADGHKLVEAFSVDAFVRAWIGVLLGSTSVPGLRAGQTEALGAAELDPPAWSIRRGSAEQSNTSVRVGDKAILKVIRKLEHGPHPELEVGRFLTTDGHFDGVPAMLGWVELAQGEETVTLSVLQQFVPNEGDGWGWLLDRLQRAAGPDGGTELREATAWIRQVGRRTAEMHRAFATDSNDPDFRPEPIGQADVQSWTEAVHSMAERALDGLGASLDRLDPATRAMADVLLSRRDEMNGRVNALLQDVPSFAKTRHHGDYHLGQVLVAGGDAIIVDFEGEPMRPLTERRARHAALRDVAGMLRSLAYAEAAARGDVTDPARRQCLSAWVEHAASVFLDAYMDAVEDSPGCPPSRPDAERIVRFFMLEKALYEVVYELANRPTWVSIPLAGVLGLLDADTAGRRRAHRMPFGAECQADGTVRFRLWATPHPQVSVLIDGGASMPMQAVGDGWHELVTDRAHVGSRYQFVLPDGLRVHDPASRFQPEDVHGPSEVIDPTAYIWGDMAWKGRRWEEAVVYELHIGAFTPEGTFRSAIGKLDHLVCLGVTAIEIMPIGDFPGRRGWGYDGVLPYAPDGAYGRPEDLKALIEAAHIRGLMVLLDVVYNHFGPDGAYVHVIAPETFTDRHRTPWGAAINTDGARAAPVREFFIHNALYWMEEFHLDGLRLDAVHAILDDSPKHLLAELAERVRAAVPDRAVHLVLENEENAASRLRRDADGRPRWYTAQWNDDLHHVLHVAASGEATGYYGDYHGDTDKLGRALAQGFAFQGELMPYRGHERGEPSADLSTMAFVAFIQNHDQIGNRAFGDRLTASAPAAAVRAVAAVYLLLPQIPMLFMGEEWAAAQPFPFFCDFGPELGAAVRNGRREEFARFPEFQDPAKRDTIPDPTAETTFVSSKLVWDDAKVGIHAEWLDFYRRVLAIRHAEIVPRLTSIPSGGHYELIDDAALVVQWDVGQSGELLTLAANLKAVEAQGFPPVSGQILWLEGSVRNDRFGPWSVRWSIEPRSCGARSPALLELADRMSVEPSFRDARGQTVEATPETKQALLAAMGLDVSDEAHAQAELERLRRTDWLQPLAPVTVHRTDAGPATADVVFPAGTQLVIWRLRLEDGAERSGESRFDQLALTEETDLDGQRLQRRRLVLGDELPWGYHQLELLSASDRDPLGVASLVVTPGRCWLPPVVSDGKRLWGIAAQLYLLRSATDWGIGDFGDLRSLVELAAAHGADLIGLNPLHGMFHDNPNYASPYSPASRLLLNIINIDILALPELADCEDTRNLIASPAFRDRLHACRTQRLVDYERVTDLKLNVLHRLFEVCRTAAGKRWQAFDTFRRNVGEVLERHCLFLALREHFAAQGPSWADWHNWPEEYRDPSSPAVAGFAQGHRDRVEFLVWLQWIADEQLAAAARAAADRGMRVGLYRDLAVGADRSGAETWANSRAVISGAQVGAPPDIHNPLGQDWGLPPFHPRVLREEGYRSFIELVRANMRHSGGLRIDHVMGLQHLYWVPQGRKPKEGAYVAYPLQDLLGILALESQRHQCLVVGEDLGTVPEGFRDVMSAANVLSYRVLYFEQDSEGCFLPPDAYPRLAVAVVGSHDLPTLRGWWEGRDLDLKQSLDLFPDENEYLRQQETRDRDKQHLLTALRQSGLLPANHEPDIPTLARAAHAYLAHTPCVLALAQIDDLTDEADPVNVPATSDEHPNWRRRLSNTLEQLAERPRFIDIAASFRKERGVA
jgi:malto-oligosyltrehalose trehalohydrolase/4-alpha-glucanotransferase